MTHHEQTVSFWAPLEDPPDADDAKLASEMLNKTLNRHCLEKGYLAHHVTLEQTSWPTTVSPRLVLTARLTARWDGVWGELRRALDEDGLLPDHDRVRPSATPPPVLGAKFWVDRATVIPSPEIGDLWHDTSDDRTYVYRGATGWQEVTAPAPKTVSEHVCHECGFFSTEPDALLRHVEEGHRDERSWRGLYGGSFTATDEICVRPPTGPAKTLSAGDTLSWTETVTLTAD